MYVIRKKERKKKKNKNKNKVETTEDSPDYLWVAWLSQLVRS